MLFKEFGNKKNKSIILIHGYGISWRMWKPQIAVFRYELPNSIADTKTDIAYWYGSKEAWLGKKYANCLLSKLPSVTIKVFQGFDHGELCIGNPDLYIKEATEFLNA